MLGRRSIASRYSNHDRFREYIEIERRKIEIARSAKDRAISTLATLVVAVGRDVLKWHRELIRCWSSPSIVRHFPRDKYESALTTLGQVDGAVVAAEVGTVNIE